MKGITETELYKLMDILTINDAAALIAGGSPSEVRYEDNYDEWFMQASDKGAYERSEVFSIARKTLIHAVTMGRLKANIAVDQKHELLVNNDLEKDWIALKGVDSERTTIDRDDLKKWLEDRGVYPSFLFPHGKKEDYMNMDNERYAPKLAVCVKAWEAAQNITPKDKHTNSIWQAG